ncbi:hypothetical protein N665_0406s0010 [Sinapis alba]|nr:hypothetical protein N665_0406s0010 [Sinapis alba]
MWFGERINKRVKKTKHVFTKCCKQGKVKLPLLEIPPATLLTLFYNGDEKSKHFREFIRAYNMMFSFTSLGGKVNHSVNNRKGPYLFQLCGENYHRISDLLPGPDKDPAFLQLYIHDTVNEIQNKIKACSKMGSAASLDESIVVCLKKMLDTHNPHVKTFR